MKQTEGFFWAKKETMAELQSDFEEVNSPKKKVRPEKKLLDSMIPRKLKKGSCVEG